MEEAAAEAEAAAANARRAVAVAVALAARAVVRAQTSCASSDGRSEFLPKSVQAGPTPPVAARTHTKVSQERGGGLVSGASI